MAEMEWRSRYMRGLHHNKTAPNNGLSAADALGDPCQGESLPDEEYADPPAINEQGRAGLKGNKPNSDTDVV